MEEIDEAEALPQVDLRLSFGFFSYFAYFTFLFGFRENGGKLEVNAILIDLFFAG